MPRPRHPQRPGHWLAGLLVFALLGLQALGQAHRVAHPALGSAGHGAAVAAEPALAHGAMAPASPARAVAALQGPGLPFGHEQQAGECRLFDQLVLGDLAFAGAEAGAVPPPTGAAAARHAEAPRRASAPIQRARGPPAIAA